MLRDSKLLDVLLSYLCTHSHTRKHVALHFKSINTGEKMQMSGSAHPDDYTLTCGFTKKSFQ